jgi:glycosyltransferase involved in cell wall biosynthesis
MLGRLGSDALAGWYARAAIYALPARYEPFGLSALEAAHSGCALVLGDIPSLREIWGDAAVFVPPEDCPALENAIRGLIDDPERRQSMADAARERASRYTPARMAEQYLAAYHSVNERRRACAS